MMHLSASTQKQLKKSNKRRDRSHSQQSSTLVEPNKKRHVHSKCFWNLDIDTKLYKHQKAYQTITIET